MKLTELLCYDNIAIQCHNEPDADAIASGWALQCYLLAQGKSAWLIYGGAEEIQKPNLCLMKERLHIPVRHVQSLPEETELLVYVDCQGGGSKVQSFLPPETTVETAVIDHHKTGDAPLPALQEVRPTYGSCSTILWDMLTEAEFDVRQNKELSTALYYGLFTDTGRLQELRHPKDKDLRDALHFSCLQNLLFLLQNCNISRHEMDIVGQALSGGCRYNEQYRFAVAAVRPCDPNILGIISDMLMEADDIDVCVAYCMKDAGAKISVRSCTPSTRAHELAAYLTGDGGGHARKAGGFLHRSQFLPQEADALQSSQEAGDCLWQRMEAYFRDTVCITAGQPGVPDLTVDTVYRKERLPIGYVKATDLYPAGTEVSVRMLEGDITFTVKEDTYFMIGIEGEVYQNSAAHFETRNDLSDEPYVFHGEYAPNVRSAISTINLDGPPETPKDLLSYVKTCIPKGGCIYARQIHRFTKIFVTWSDDYLLGRPGDWMACPVERPLDVYIIKDDIFHKSYRRAEDRSL